MDPSSSPSPIREQLEEIHRRHRELREGEVATYIPELAKADPEWFGICLVTAGGSIYEVGDSRQPFTIQSISKPFVYGLALEDNSRADVLKKVGVEPSGDAFNSISLDSVSGRPLNPMINAGAIATTGLIAGKDLVKRSRRLLEMFGNYAGRELTIDEAVYRSENETGHRNRAIGHMLRNVGILTENPDGIVDLYFKQCSISATCRDLAVMAATLANRGVNPVTRKQAIRGEYVESVLGVMGTCGMYDFAGEWIYKIGLPAKSGVAGGIIAVLPGQLGIGVFSPRVDPRGNSVRGIRVCDDLSRLFDLHLFNPPHAVESVIRLKFTAAEIGSSRLRNPAESAVLRESGARIQVYELQGSLVFSTTEVVAHDLARNATEFDYLIFDMRRVLGINESAARLVVQFLRQMEALKKPILFAHASHLPFLRRYAKATLGDNHERLFRTFDDTDVALEWCENQLLARALPAFAQDGAVELSDYELFQGLSSDELTTIGAMLQRRSYRQSETIVQFGDEARELFFLARGRVSVSITLDSGGTKRLATFSPGMAFGEMAVLDGARRSAVVVADTDVECDLLTVEDFQCLIDSHPRIKIALLRNISLSLCRKLRKANRELSALGR
jgi:glutaminase